MICECERCKSVLPCAYHGSPPDIEADKAQDGEWLCEECVPLRIVEVDDAIEHLKKHLGRI